MKRKRNTTPLVDGDCHVSTWGFGGRVSVQGARYEVIRVIKAKLVEQLVDMTNEVLVDGKNGYTKAVRVRGRLSGRVKTNG